MAADIEAESAIFDSSREPSHAARISFKNFRPIAVAGKFVAGSKTGWPSSYNEDPTMVGIRQIPSLRRFWYTRIKSRVKQIAGASETETRTIRCSDFIVIANRVLWVRA